ncbi:UNVERIFIED_ORG: hypothetical protein LHJ69_12760 [Shinella sp. XGS7]|nr:hypothetical protein [Shinella sp. XGS7]
MSRGRYTPLQLHVMAKVFNQAERQGDPRAQLLVLMVSVRTGLSTAQVRAEIAQLAATGY